MDLELKEEHDGTFPPLRGPGRGALAGGRLPWGAWARVARTVALGSQTRDVAVREITISARLWYGDYFGDLEFDRMAAGSPAALLPEQVFSHSLRLHNPFFSLKSRTIMREG